ncbi:MAG: PhzF family phenazine biosynthesis protein [Gemmatimonadales bacterium]
MPLPITVVDAFTDKPFSGNPAGVCVLPAERDRTWMQNVAREMNQAETAFMLIRPDHVALRWFTPTIEMDLCGHATIASAHALWEQHTPGIGEKIRFRTKSGDLFAEKDGSWIALDFPALPSAKADAPPGLLDALGTKPKAVSKYKFDYLVELGSEAEVRELKPDLGQIARLPERGVVITAVATTPGFDFVSRFFAPAVGVPEDPVTGSAHCALAPYWAARLGKSEFMAYQASARGGVVKVAIKGDRVALCGKAVTVLRAELVDTGR